MTPPCTQPFPAPHPHLLHPLRVERMSTRQVCKSSPGSLARRCYINPKCYHSSTKRFKLGWGPRDCVINTSPTFSALGRRCWGRKTVLSSIFNCSGMRVLGRPPYRNPLKIPIDVYLAPDSVLLPTGSKLNHSACAMVRSWGPPMAAPSPSAASPQALLLPVPFPFILPPSAG